MKVITVTYSTLLQLLVKGLFAHIDKTCEIARVVDVRTKTDVYMRPIVKIYPLEEQTFDEVPQGGCNITETNAENGG